MITKIVLDPAQLHENGRTPVFVPFVAGGSGGYWNVGTMARWKFTTTATYGRVRIFSNLAPGGANNNSTNIIPLRVNDVDMWAGFADLGDHWYDFSIPGGAGVSKTVELWVGPQHATGMGLAPLGQYPIEAEFNATATYIAPVTTGNHRVIYSDSIGVGASAIIPQLSYAGLMKRPSGSGGFNGRTTLVAHGYRTFADDVASGSPMAYNSTKAAAFVAQLVALAPTEIDSRIGINDWLNVWSSSAALQGAVTGFFGLLGAALPSVPIKVTSPLITTDREGSFGALTGDDIRNAFQAGVAAVGLSNVTFENGKTIISAAQLADSPHPATESHATIRATRT